MLGLDICAGKHAPPDGSALARHLHVALIHLRAVPRSPFGDEVDVVRSHRWWFRCTAMLPLPSIGQRLVPEIEVLTELWCQCGSDGLELPVYRCGRVSYKLRKRRSDLGLHVDRNDRLEHVREDHVEERFDL